MVQRQATDFNLAAQDGNAQYSQNSAGLQGVQAQQVAQVGGGTQFGAPDASGSRVLQSILGDIGAVAGIGMKVDQEDAYLKGAIAAGSGEEEAALQSDFITKDWATAGFRDMTAKLKIAESEAKLTEDMKDLRQVGPEQMKEYLLKRSDTLTPQLAGMSREQRAGAFASLLSNDRAAIATHAAEHAKFQVEQLVKTAQVGNAVQSNRLNAALASNDPRQYDEALMASAAYIASNIILEPRIPARVKAEMTTSVVEQALGAGHVKLYTELRDNKLPGSDKTLLEQLPLADQYKLSQAHRAAMDKNDGIINRELMTKKALITAEMAQGTHTGTWQDANQRADEWLRAYPGDFKGGEAILNQFLEYKNKDHNSDAIAMAGATGDFAKAQTLGADEHKTIATLRDKMNRDGVSAADQISILLSTGKQGGSSVAYQEVGKSVGLAVASLDNADGTLNTNNSQIIQTVMQAVSGLHKEGLANSEAAVLSGMSDSTRLRFQRLQGAADKGLAPEQALKWVQGQEIRDKDELPATKAAREQALGKEVLSYQENIAPAGTWSRFLAHLPLVGRTLEQKELSPKTSWWDSMTDNSTVTHQYSEVAKGAIDGEIKAELLRPNSGDPAAIVKAAEAKVLARKIDTTHGPLILPQDQTPASYFGISASPAEIGRAVSNLIPVSSKKSRVAFEAAQGRISYTEYNDSGNVVLQEKQSIDPKAVAVEVKRIQDNNLMKTNEAVGAGVSVTAGGATMSYNGQNTASMDEVVMLNFRKAMVKYEGYADKPAPDIGGAKHADGSPVMTGGFGISSTNTYYPKGDKITPQQWMGAFQKATNEAATVGVKVTQQYGLRGPAWKQLASELAYQSGAATLEKSPAYQALFQHKDGQRSTDALMQTPAWKASGAERQRHLMSLLTQANNRG